MKIFNLEADIKEQYQNAVNEERTSGAAIDSNHRIEFERNYYKYLVEDFVCFNSKSEFILWNGVLYRRYEKVNVYSKNEEMEGIEFLVTITYSDFQEGIGEEVAFIVGNSIYPATKFYSE